MPRVNPNLVEAALEGGEDEELVGGIQRTRRTRLPTEDRPGGKNKTPRRREESIFPEEIQAPAVVLPAVAVAKPPEKKGVIEVKNNGGAQIAQTRPEFEPCPLCGYGKSTEKKFLICKADNDRYLLYVKKEIAANKNPAEIFSKIEWVAGKLNIPLFEQELKEAQQARANANVRIEEKIRIAAGGKTLPREVFIELRAKVVAEINAQDYHLVKRLYARLEAAKKLKLELEQKIAEEATRPIAALAEAEATAEAPAELVVASTELSTVVA